MQYTLYDHSSYGADNGVSSTHIGKYVAAKAKELGISVNEYSGHTIVHAVNHDESLRELALQTYVPYPASPGWTDEYKAYYQTLLDEKRAPGYGEVPDEAVNAVIDRLLMEVFETKTKPRLAREAAAAAEKAEAESFFASITTSDKTITDEGGKTTQYTHTFVTKDGRTLTFVDRNSFDFGRTITPAYSVLPGMEPGGLHLLDDGVHCWHWFDESKGWYPLRPLDEAELAALTVLKHIGHGNARIRM